MFRARERGMSFWPFAISLLALIVLLIRWLDATSKRDQFQKNAEQAKAAQADAETRLTEANQKLLKVSEKVGFTGGGSASDPALIEAQIKEYGGKLKESLIAVYPA